MMLSFFSLTRLCFCLLCQHTGAVFILAFEEIKFDSTLDFKKMLSNSIPCENMLG